MTDALEILVRSSTPRRPPYTTFDDVLLINGVDILAELDHHAALSPEALFASAREPGAHFIVTCTCGVPECGGWAPVRVEHDDAIVSWELEHAPRVHRWTFHADAYRAAIACFAEQLRAVAAYRETGEQKHRRPPPLVWAVAERKNTLAAALLRTGSPVDERDAAGRTALHHAVATHAHELASALIARGSVDAADPEGATPLHLAADVGDAPMVRLLLRARASAEPGLKRSGLRPLHLAARASSRETVQLLLDAGADPEARDTQGWSALDWALYESAEDEVVAVLRAHGATAKTDEERMRDRFGG